MDQKKIGKYIASKRKQLGMTQVIFAEKLGVTNKAVSKWERGVCLPDASKYEDVCILLEISLNELFAGEDLIKDNIVQQSEINILGIAQYAEMNKRKLKIVCALMMVLFLIVSCYYINLNVRIAVTETQHLGPLVYDMPNTEYVHAKKDVILEETGFGNEKAVRGKKYTNKTTKAKITIYEHTEWDEFMPTIEYEKSTNYDLVVSAGNVENYKTKPGFLKSITVFVGEHDESDQYSHYYKAYIRVNMKSEERDYILTIQGNSYETVKSIGEAVINSMSYDNSLENEFVLGRMGWLLYKNE